MDYEEALTQFTGTGETTDGGRVTINDVARLARVSKKTVSRVINDSPMVKEETRARVKAVIDDLGFTPDPQARALAFGRSLLIGMIYDNPNPQYVVNMQRGILDGLEDTSLQLVLRPCDRTTDKYLDQVRNFVVYNRPTGVVLPPSLSEDERVASLLRELDCAYVRIACVELDSARRMMRTHDAKGGEQAALHLAGLGHMRIAHIHGPLRFRSTHERLAGFRLGLASKKIQLADDMIYEGHYTFEGGLEAAEALLSRPDRPSAIFTGNDEMAMSVYVTARRLGLRIPEDLSVVGYDDTPMSARVWPAMTTLRLPIRDMGRVAARMLIDQDASGAMMTVACYTPELVVRGSTAKFEG